MKSSRILTIIVTYNAMQWIDRCLTSLRQSSMSCDVLCIDNGSSDGSQDYIRKTFPEVELIQAESNLGFGKANNIGLQRVLDQGYDFAYLLNQDAWVMPETFQIMTEIADRHPDYGLLSPMQMKADMKHLEDRFLNVILRWKTSLLNLFDDFYNQNAADIYDVSFVMAAHWLLTSQCIEKVGGFSPTFYHYGEDVNYIERVNYWNLKTGIVPTAKAVHDRADSAWNFKKHLFIDWYLPALGRLSDPKQKGSLSREMFSLLKYALRHLCKPMADYTILLWKNRQMNENNRLRSQKERAFLI